jgi:hypothetical protein
MMRSRLVTGIAVAAAVAVGGVGGAIIGVPALSGAQTFPKGATTAAASGTSAAKPGVRDSALLDAAAKALNLTPQQLQAKLSDGKTTIADVAKQQNVDINTVIDAMATADRDRISNIVNNPWPKFGDHRGGGRGPGGNFGPGFGRGGFGIIGDAFGSVAKALGISTADLKTDLAKGQSIADIAKAKNLDVNTVITTLVGDAKAKIDKAVTDKHLTQAQADKIEANLQTEITALVNGTLAKPPNFGGPMTGGPMTGGPNGGGFHRHGGYGGPGSGSGTGTPSTPSTTAPIS